MKKEFKGWAIKDDNGYYWIDVPPDGWFGYDLKVYNATLTVDDSDLTAWTLYTAEA